MESISDKSNRPFWKAVNLLQSAGSNAGKITNGLKCRLPIVPPNPALFAIARQIIVSNQFQTIPAGRKVSSISNTVGAFAALLDDGSVLAWGDANFGGTTPTIPAGHRVFWVTGSKHHLLYWMIPDYTPAEWGI